MHELEQLKTKYKEYYQRNRKHLKYKNVKETIAIMRERIAMLEHEEMKSKLNG